MSSQTATDHTASGARSVDRGSRMPVRLYHTSEPTPCQTVDPNRTRNGQELWFSQFKDRVLAVRDCQGCPFIGRCGYNAVAAREEYGVWGGVSLPGDKSDPELLGAAYEYLLAQFERRRSVELPGLPAPAMPSSAVRRRRASADVHSSAA
ncbi:WhiB family transcriptional regulator [Mycolicibacterium vinylchloridicum]|uniref:WhiB family transcriptional regulator n=1 Tax=Mycolicibacterium vinylchloridicum TaxID=2736928 RepID=UPI00022E3D70|nr:WhiB family transcriptional regulator [Mycolicibacterium vinylchloridicum]EHB46432.1 transcription factor WhiB [Mycolicibacterium rhodesiae JS60]